MNCGSPPNLNFEENMNSDDLPTGADTLLLAPEPSKKPPLSEARLAANRANALLSRGPVSPRGKAMSSLNNFRHGLTQSEGKIILLPSEFQEQYNNALAAFLEEWNPTTPTERNLVERLACRQWLRRRAMRLQKQFLHTKTGLIADYPNFELYRRFETRHERAYDKALDHLIRIRTLLAEERRTRPHQ
jgi:hypothetical protein